MTEALHDDWPSEPYKGLAHYGPDDRPLFTGRDQDVDVCMRYLAAPETRILLLHGQTGCGKSSFLRAGLIPSLEERALGYLFLRDSEGAPLFIRCGPDPIGRIAEQLFRFVSHPITVESINGSRVYDMTQACLGQSALKDYVETCRRPGALIRSLQIVARALPYTLVIILDQAEEVITLPEAKPEHRRQFFRFVREFATTNFPLKFVLALRKDNSGEFMGLAQVGGSFELPPLPTSPSRPTAPADQEPSLRDLTDRTVISDIKIFLLSELTPDEVVRAILQPTLKEPVEGRRPPFAKYQFDYEDGVADRIVHDIFKATSSTAVLPVMQIVCRDLYKRATTEDAGASVTDATVHERPKPWHIDHALYETAGGIQGPVDRHVSRSLISSFCGTVRPGDTKDEERRWRDILFRLVRRESDGTVHTNIVSLTQLRAFADEVEPLANVDQVVEYLAKPEVLLLRSVTILSADDRDEVRWYSLGHDFIAMVLQQWKVREEEAEAAHRRFVKNMKTAGWALAGVAGIALIVIPAVYLARERGTESSKHDVLINAATYTQREDPMFAMLAATHATRVATELSNYGLPLGRSAQDHRAEQMLARILAGLPQLTNFSDDVKPVLVIDPASASIPLPKSMGFLRIDGVRVEMVTNVTTAPQRKVFELGPLPQAPLGISLAEKSIAIGEPTPGTSIILRSVSTSPARDIEFTSYQVFVLANGQKLGPFDADYFRNFDETDAARRKPPAKANAADKARAVGGLKDSHSQQALNPLEVLARYARDGFTRLELSGGVVVLYTFKPPAPNGKGHVTVDSFVVADGNDGRAFQRGVQKATFDFNANNIGLANPLFVDGYLVLPKPAADQAPNKADALDKIVRYDLRRDPRGPDQGVEVDKLAEVMQCSADGRCPWQPILGSDPPSLLVVGRLRPSKPALARAADQLPDLETFERLVVADVSSGRSTALDVVDLARYKDECFPPSESLSVETAGSTPLTPLFVTGHVDALVIGFPKSHLVDVMRVAGIPGGRVKQCIGRLMVPPDISQWRASGDGTTLIGIGPKLGTTWALGQTVADRAQGLIGKGQLDKLACASGLAQYKVAEAHWTARTFLKPEPDPCGTIPAASPNPPGVPKPPTSAASILQ